MNRSPVLLLTGALAVLTSAYLHFYLYFWGGYRGISPERFAGIDISRSFALNAIAGLVIAELLVLSLRFERWSIPAAVLGIGYAAGALVAYAVVRSSSLLGFSEHGWTTESVISKLAELVAVMTLGGFVAINVRRTRTPRQC